MFMQIFYFSFVGWNNFGGYDVFWLRCMVEGWMFLVNFGLFVNFSYNDFYYSLSGDMILVFLASNWIGVYYLDDDFEACCNDLYVV